jgi:hypothetical protein
MKTQVLRKELPVVMDMYSVVLPLRRRASGLARSDHVRMFSPSRWHQSAITDLKWSLCAVDRFSRDAFSPRHLPSYWGLSMSDTFFMKGEREWKRLPGPRGFNGLIKIFEILIFVGWSCWQPDLYIYLLLKANKRGKSYRYTSMHVIEPYGSQCIASLIWIRLSLWSCQTKRCVGI